jgi:hypothetical protein
MVLNSGGREPKTELARSWSLDHLLPTHDSGGKNPVPGLVLPGERNALRGILPHSRTRSRRELSLCRGDSRLVISLTALEQSISNPMQQFYIT